MAELSKVNFGGTEYDIKDTVARNKQVSQLSVSMDASGGTIAPKYADGSTGTGISIPIATEEKAGVMSAEDKQHLNAALNHVGETNYLPDYVGTPILSWNGDEEIVTIEAATEERAGVMSSADKKKLDTLISASTHALSFIGFTSTALTDGATTSTLVAAEGKTLTKTTGFTVGDVVFYGMKEFIWNGSSWTEFGDGSSLRALAFKDSASGTVTIPSTTHTHTTPSLSHSVTQGTVSASGSYTPEGTVTITDRTDIESSTESDNGGFIGTNNAKKIGAGDKILTNYETESVTIKPVGGTTSVQSMTGVGTLPTSEVKNIPNVTSVGVMFKAEVVGETLKLTAGTAPTLGTAISVNSMKSAGTLPTRQAVTVATAGADKTFKAVSLQDWGMPGHTHPTVAEMVNASFAGTAKTVSVTGKTTGVAVANHAAGNTGAPSGTESKTVTVQ